jgi:hypothetical protein
MNTERIPLRTRDGRVRAYALVDADDLPGLSAWRWSYSGGAAVRAVRIDGRSRTVLMHRQIMGLEHGDPREVDHRNADRLDNRRSNLRVCSHAENHQNRSAVEGASSRFRGVCWDRRMGRWQAKVKLNGRTNFLGYYEIEEDASAAVERFRAERMPFSVVERKRAA